MIKEHHSDLINRLVTYFANSKLTPLIIVMSVLLGLFAVVNLPREEEPQISVPIFDVFVSYPGASAEEVERRIVNLAQETRVLHVHQRDKPDPHLVSFLQLLIDRCVAARRCDRFPEHRGDDFADPACLGEGLFKENPSRGIHERVGQPHPQPPQDDPFGVERVRQIR